MSDVRHFDPRMFIEKPFVGCPKCGQPEYGVLDVRHHRYTRRCRACWHTDEYPLPPVLKKIVYLDQFAITNLMYVHTKAEKRLDPFWRELYSKLKWLSNLNGCLPRIDRPREGVSRGSGLRTVAGWV